MVSGQVLDMEGRPVYWVAVRAYNTVFGSGKVPTAYTDERGMFLIKRLTPGTYEIAAEKREDGYPSSDSKFHAAGFVQAPRVEVYEQQTTEGVAVRLAPKATKLVARVFDAETKRPVKDVKMLLTRVDNPEYSRTEHPDVHGRIHALLPPTPVTIQVSAPGYKDWHQWEPNSPEAGGTPSPPKPLKQLTVFLEPVS